MRLGTPTSIHKLLPSATIDELKKRQQEGIARVLQGQRATGSMAIR
jgi:hypothetical protein